MQNKIYKKARERIDYFLLMMCRLEVTSKEIRVERRKRREEDSRKKLDSLVTDFLCLPTAATAAAVAQMAGENLKRSWTASAGRRDAS